MTGDFTEFFKKVREAAKQHGIKAHLVCGVARDGAGGQVRVASHGGSTLDEQNPQFRERCFDAMEESLDLALEQLSDKHDAPTQLLN